MMDGNEIPSKKTLKEAIFDLQEPVVFRHILQDKKGSFVWPLLQWDLLELEKKFGDMKLSFRVGYNAKSMHPQWEKQCHFKTMTFAEFVEETNSVINNDIWYYFDYKYMYEWVQDKPDLLTSLNWHRFGIEKDGHDSTVWIGNKGAHTNCHFDSYGCNLIAQVYGRKQWILFPPSSTNGLCPTRIPYEESTIYSKYNFFCPTNVEEEAILRLPQQAKSIILEKGDVLFVPKGWWHYVESLDLTVSVNVWLPLPTDSKARLKEALVKLIVNRIGKNICENPEETCHTLSQNMKTLKNALMECESTTTERSPAKKKLKRSVWTAEDLTKEHPFFVKLLHDLEKSDLENLLKCKRERFVTSIDDTLQTNVPTSPTSEERTKQSSQLSKDVINTFCHPDIIDKAADLLLETRGNQ